MIKWSEIEAELQAERESLPGYKELAVQRFRKYEGQETDERTKQGKVVRVTYTNFASHAGIPEPTFRHWLEAEGFSYDRSAKRWTASETTKRKISAHDRARLDAIKEHPEDVVQQLLDNPEARQEVEDRLAAIKEEEHQKQVAEAEKRAAKDIADLPEPAVPTDKERYEVEQTRLVTTFKIKLTRLTNQVQQLKEDYLRLDPTDEQREVILDRMKNLTTVLTDTCEYMAMTQNFNTELEQFVEEN